MILTLRSKNMNIIGNIALTKLFCKRRRDIVFASVRLFIRIFFFSARLNAMKLYTRISFENLKIRFFFLINTIECFSGLGVIFAKGFKYMYIPIAVPLICFHQKTLFDGVFISTKYFFSSSFREFLCKFNIHKKSHLFIRCKFHIPRVLQAL